MYYKNNTIRINKDKIISLFVVNGGFYAVFSFCFFTAIKIIPVSLATIIFYTYPIILALISIIFKRYVLTKRVFMLMLLSFLGLLLSIGVKFNINKLIGIFLAEGSALFYSLYTLYSTNVLKKFSLIESITFSYFFSVIAFFITGILKNEFYLNIGYKTWIIVILISIISLMGFLFFLKALTIANPINVSIITMFEPVITILLSITLLGESLNYLQISGIIMVMVALYKVIFNKELLKAKS
jgi:drug/metabolite transporter (DMT)-like permease